MAVKLLLEQDALLFQVGDNLSRHVLNVLSREPVKALQVDTVLVQGCDDGQVVDVCQVKVLLAAAGGNVDDTGAFLGADLLPGDDPVFYF
ncbi:hypothetical protein ES703_123055 [subsurface metagenome]